MQNATSLQLPTILTVVNTDRHNQYLPYPQYFFLFFFIFSVGRPLVFVMDPGTSQ